MCTEKKRDREKRVTEREWERERVSGRNRVGEWVGDGGGYIAVNARRHANSIRRHSENGPRKLSVLYRAAAVGVLICKTCVKAYYINDDDDRNNNNNNNGNNKPGRRLKTFLVGACARTIKMRASPPIRRFSFLAAHPALE